MLDEVILDEGNLVGWGGTNSEPYRNTCIMSKETIRLFLLPNGYFSKLESVWTVVMKSHVFERFVQIYEKQIAK